MSQKVKKKVKVKGASDEQDKKKVEKKVNDLDGVIEVVYIDDDIFDIMYDEAILEEAALLAAIEDLGYDEVIVTDACGCD